MVHDQQTQMYIPAMHVVQRRHADGIQSANGWSGVQRAGTPSCRLHGRKHGAVQGGGRPDAVQRHTLAGIQSAARVGHGCREQEHS